MNVLLTGGCGYIGSHTVVALCNAGHNSIIVDDFSNSHPEVLRRLKKLTGKEMAFYDLNILDTKKLNEIFENHQVDAVIHFAAFKSINESIEKPISYYENNVGGLLSLLRAMESAKCSTLVHSSSCVVYGDLSAPPIKEDATVGFSNPYGHSKLICEQVIQSYAKINQNFKYGILRYFNPAGAHESGLIGEDPKGVPSNLIPYISQLAVGSLPRLKVYGDDYYTKDGTGVRDYIHVMDLAEGHLASLNYLCESNGESHLANLGTGFGYSVLDVIDAFRIASGQKIEYEVVERRPGDIANIFADASLAKEKLGWVSKRSLNDICDSGWNWQEKNPNGYRA